MFYNIGPSSSGLFWFFLFSIFNASFNGLKGVIISNLIIGLTVAAFIIIIPLFEFVWPGITNDFYTSNIWWFTGITLFFLNIITSSAVAFIMNHFEKALSIGTDSKSAIIIGLASLAEYRDTNTGKHLERISKYTILLANELMKISKYNNYINEHYIEDLSLSAILHDIGKVAIQDKVLLKEGKLTHIEFEAIKLHTIIGSHVIENIREKMKDQNFLKLANQIIMHHHEKYNGTGYPMRLKGEEIPLSARIVALVDVYDALTSQRVYKDAFSHEKSVDIIISDKGKHFDPDIVDVFINIHKKFNEIRITVTE